MQQEMLNDIVSIIKDQKLDKVLSENTGIRRAYCQKILMSDAGFFLKAVNNNFYDYIKDYYILKKDIVDEENLKDEEMELIKKYIIYSNLKKLDKSTLDRLKTVNESLQFKNIGKKISNNNDYREKVINFIRQNDKRFYNNYLKSSGDINDKDTQINMVRDYNNYLKNIS